MAMIDEVKEQTRKMKDMTPGQRWSYFWGYYKFHVLIILCVAFFLITLIRDMVTNKDTVFYTAVVNANVDAVTDEVTNAWDTDLAELLEINPKKEEISFDTSFTLSNDRNGQFDYTTIQKLMVMAGARSLDAVIANTGAFEYYAQSTFFLPLQDVLTEEQYKRLEPYFYYTDMATVADDDENLEMEELEAREAAKKAAVIDHHDPSSMEKPVAVGLFVEGSAKLQSSGAYDLLTENGDLYQGYPESGVVGIAAATKHTDYAVKFIDYFFE